MKIRNGFVSNSSSSSFVIVTDKETFEDVLNTFSETERDFLREIFYDTEEMKLDGKEYITLFGELQSESICEIWWETNPDDSGDDAVDTVDSFIEAFKDKKNSFSRNK